jgi:hypothetical protein
MNALVFLSVTVVVLVSALGGIAVWSPRRLALKVTALATTALLLPVAYVGLTELMGWPKSARFEWNPATFDEVQVLAAELKEGEAIYLWLRLDGASSPRAYVLPWDIKLAQQLHDAQKAARDQGTTPRMRGVMRRSSAEIEKEPVFYADPQPALPPKL